jgi:hypothetical protein
MYINLHINPNNKTEIVCFTNINTVGNFDDVCDYGEATEIIAMDVLEYLPHHKVQESIAYWLSKLEHSGTLVLGGIDLDSVNKAYYRRDINVHQYNELVFGTQDMPCNFKRTATTVADLKKFMEINKIKIVELRLIGFSYIMKVVRT